MNFIVKALLFYLLSGGLVAGTILLAKPLRKIANTYWFWLGIGLTYLIISMSCLWVRNWVRFAHFINSPVDVIGYHESKVIASAFFTNLCWIIWLLLPTFLILDPSRKLARAIAPIAIIASVMVVFVDIPWNPTIEFNARGLFWGNHQEPDMHYFTHVINLLLAIGIVNNTPRFGWKGAVSQYVVLGSMYIYVAIIMGIFHINHFVSGLHLNDFGTGGTYNIFANLLHLPPVAGACLFFPFFFGLIFGVVVLCDCIQNTKHFRYADKYSGTWWKWYDYASKDPMPLDWGWFSMKHRAKHAKSNAKIEEKVINPNAK